MDNDKILSYLDPERYTFTEFVFRDSNGLYKYDGKYPNLKKIYVDKDESFADTCKRIGVKHKNIELCNKFFFDALLNYDSMTINDLLKVIPNTHNFFNGAKEQIEKMDINIVLSLLKKFGFKQYSDYVPLYKMYINKMENISFWISRQDPANKDKLNKNQNLLKYLQLLVDYVNSNPAILNTDFTEFESQLYYLKEFEEYMKVKYNKIAIFKDITEGYLDINDERTNSMAKLVLQNTTDAQLTISTSKITNLLKDYHEKLHPKIKLSKQTIDKLTTNLVIYFDAEKKIADMIANLTKYIYAVKHHNINLDNSLKKVPLTEENIKDGFTIFIQLKNLLAKSQQDFLSKYPKAKFIL